VRSTLRTEPFRLQRAKPSLLEDIIAWSKPVQVVAATPAAAAAGSSGPQKKQSPAAK
jgi:hypothetical protein